MIVSANIFIQAQLEVAAIVSFSAHGMRLNVQAVRRGRCVIDAASQVWRLWDNPRSQAG
jgi:hypothetical protein